MANSSWGATHVCVKFSWHRLSQLAFVAFITGVRCITWPVVLHRHTRSSTPVVTDDKERWQLCPKTQLLLNLWGQFYRPCNMKNCGLKIENLLCVFLRVPVCVYVLSLCEYLCICVYVNLCLRACVCVASTRDRNNRLVLAASYCCASCAYCAGRLLLCRADQWEFFTWGWRRPSTMPAVHNSSPEVLLQVDCIAWSFSVISPSCNVLDPPLTKLVHYIPL